MFNTQSNPWMEAFLRSVKCASYSEWISVFAFHLLCVNKKQHCLINSAANYNTYLWLWITSKLCVFTYKWPELLFSCGVVWFSLMLWTVGNSFRQSLQRCRLTESGHKGLEMNPQSLHDLTVGQPLTLTDLLGTQLKVWEPVRVQIGIGPVSLPLSILCPLSLFCSLHVIPVCCLVYVLHFFGFLFAAFAPSVLAHLISLLKFAFCLPTFCVLLVGLFFVTLPLVSDFLPRPDNLDSYLSWLPAIPVHPLKCCFVILSFYVNQAAYFAAFFEQFAPQLTIIVVI